MEVKTSKIARTWIAECGCYKGKGRSEIKALKALCESMQYGSIKWKYCEQKQIEINKLHNEIRGLKDEIKWLEHSAEETNRIELKNMLRVAGYNIPDEV